MDSLAPSRLDDLKKRYEENPRRFFAPLANEYRKNGDLDQAIALCQEHVAAQPGNMNGQVVYGQALFDAGRYEEAETTFNTALTLDPENLIALRHLGDIARLIGMGPQALEWYKRVLDADPRNEEILAFIDELKSAAPAAPAEPPPAAGTPTPSIPVASVPPSSAPTIEVEPPRVSLGQPAPALPMETVEAPAAPRQSGPKKRASVPLIDLDMDLGGDSHPPEEPPMAAPSAPSAPDAPVGDIEFGNFDFGEAPAAPVAEAEASAPHEEAGQRAADLAMDTSIGFDMGGNVDLPSSDAPIDEPTTEPRPAVFVTETMAELYLQQGFRDEALKVYRQLAEQNPDDASLQDRIAALEGGGRASMTFEKLADDTPDLAPGTDSIVPMSEASTPVPDPEVASATRTPVRPMTPSGQSARAFFASLAQRRALRPDGTLPKGMPAIAAAEAPAAPQGGGSVDTLFGAAPDAADDAMGQALATAVGLVEASAPIRGRPTEKAGSELSLDSVFRSESPLRTSGPVRQSQVLKFDQFFSAEQPAGEETPAAPDPAAGPPAPADDAQFQAWLQQLKGQ